MGVRDIQGCFIILMAALVLGFGVNAFSPAGIPLFGQWDETAGVIMADPKKAAAFHAKEINNPLKVKQMIESGNVVLVDVRRADMYAQGHLPGALSYPLDAFDQGRSQFLNNVKKNARVIVYCSGVTCRDSHTFGTRLLEMGYVDVLVYAGGMAEWQEMEFELE